MADPAEIARADKRCLYCDQPAVHAQLCVGCLADVIAADDDDDFDPEGPAFECAGFNDGSGFYCPLWGSEECDWECPRHGSEPEQ